MQSKSDSQAQQIPLMPNDDQLIRRGLRGDPDALEVLFARHNRALYQTALRVLGNPEDAQDALQEGLLAAYRNLRRFEGRSQFSTWLTRIVINAALMRRRSLRARPAVSLDEPPREDELPLAERFADAGPDPEQVYRGKELTEFARRRSRRALSAAPLGVSPARGRGTLDRRSRTRARRYPEHAQGAAVAGAPATRVAPGTTPAPRRFRNGLIRRGHAARPRRDGLCFR